MKIAKERLYVGNIMQRTIMEGRYLGGFVCETHIDCWTYKEGAHIYKTNTGEYVDAEYLTDKNGRFMLSKVLLAEKRAKQSEKDVEAGIYTEYYDGMDIMPMVSLSDVKKPTKTGGHDGTLGRFIDADSLTPYVEPNKKSRPKIARISLSMNK